jgi:hypothetical protein
VHLRYRHRHIEVDVYPSGDVRDVEETLPADQHPTAVLDGWLRAASRVESELLVSQGPKREKPLELRFDAQGKLLNEDWLNPPQRTTGCKV